METKLLSQISYLDMVNLNNKKFLLQYRYKDNVIFFHQDDVEYKLPYSNSLLHSFPCWGYVELRCFNDNYKFCLNLKQMFSEPSITAKEGKITESIINTLGE